MAVPVVFSALHAIELYAEAFESVDALDKLEAFASFLWTRLLSAPTQPRKHYPHENHLAHSR